MERGRETERGERERERERERESKIEFSLADGVCRRSGWLISQRESLA